VGAELPQVKRRALESLGYSSHPDVPGLIRNAYDTEDIPWVASALCAMGRSADEQWESQVLAQLNSPDNEVQFEAVRASGELELASAREPLLTLLDEEIEDREIKFAVIWALSQIGGEEIKEKFDELLADAVDEEEIDWIEKAVENLELSASQGLDMLDFSPDDENNELDFDEDEDSLSDEYFDEDFDEDETDEQQ
jgi:HEAT repeat protein